MKTILNDTQSGWNETIYDFNNEDIVIVRQFWTSFDHYMLLVIKNNKPYFKITGRLAYRISCLISKQFIESMVISRGQDPSR